MDVSVLIVDDNPVNLKLASSVLEASGFSVAFAQSAEEAIQAIEARAPRLVLMDIGLPDMDGLTLTRRLRSDSRYSDLTIVAFTAFAMKGDEQKALEAGCDGYITKPINTRTFAATVAAYVRAVSIGPLRGQESQS